MDKIFFHIDVNSAYLSWSAIREMERGRKEDLRTIPAIVGGDINTRHGVVLAKSIPAKAYGIVTGEPVVHAAKKCPSLVSVPPDHTYYHQKSRELMEYLMTVCPEIEQVSVDECYMDYTPVKECYPSPEEAARIIKNNIYQSFGYTVNIGISDKKVLAKMASDFQKPNRVHTLYTREIREKMWPLPIEELFMCGKSTARKLQKLGIETIGDLAQADCRMIEAHLKKHGKLLYDYANGVDNSFVQATPARAKGIGNSTTLSSDVTDREEAKKVLAFLAKKVVKRLKEANMLAGGVFTEIKYSSFQSVSHQCMLSGVTADEKEICRTACRLFDELWNGEPVRLLGIRTTKLSDKNEPVQLTIFDYEKVQPKLEKQRKLEEALGRIRKKYGEDAVRKGTAEEKTW